MKKLQFLALSILLSTGYIMQASSGNAQLPATTQANQSNWQAKKASFQAKRASKQSANQTLMTSEMGANPTNASISQFVASIAANIATATAANAQSIIKQLRDANNALMKLYPQGKGKKQAGQNGQRRFQQMNNNMNNSGTMTQN
jgi:hypothetical protein